MKVNKMAWFGVCLRRFYQMTYVRRLLPHLFFVFGLACFFCAWVLWRRYQSWEFLRPFHETAVENTIPAVVVLLLEVIFLVYDRHKLEEQIREVLQRRVRQW